MNWDQVAGKWKEIKGQARQKWGDITDDDFDRAAGKRDEIVGLVQQRYGRTKEEAEREVDDFFHRA